MTGLAGTHAFAVPDEPAARGLVDDLAEYGFALVTAGPDIGSWVVTAFDEGPYPGDDRGRQQFAAVGRRAYALAYWHGGRTIAGFFGAPEGLPDPVGPVVVRTPGARPFVPCVGLRGAPPDAELPFWDDPKYDEDTPDIDLADLEPGHRVRRVFGSSGMLGERFQRFSDASLDWTLAAKKALDGLFHNGQCVAETATAVRVAAELAKRPPALFRLDFVRWLLRAAGCRTKTLLDGKADAYAEETFRAVGIELPDLLPRWTREPPRTRYVLARLAALYPLRSKEIVHQVTAMATEYDGTRPGARLWLAEALLWRDDDLALARAKDIAAWGHETWPAWLEREDVPAVVRAGHVLTH